MSYVQINGEGNLSDFELNSSKGLLHEHNQKHVPIYMCTCQEMNQSLNEATFPDVPLFDVHHLLLLQLLTTLGPGASFGGDPVAMGSGDLQTSLKVLADTDCELYHMHIDLFLKHASPKLLK